MLFVVSILGFLGTYGLYLFIFFNQVLASFLKKKFCMIYFSLVFSGMLLMISEAPGSVGVSVHTL